MTVIVVVSSDTPEVNDVVIGVACHCTVDNGLVNEGRQLTAHK